MGTISKSVCSCFGASLRAFSLPALLAVSIGYGPRPKPSPAMAERIERGDCEVYGIVHWGLNTYTDREWGYGDEDPSRLAPARFDADQIVCACKAGGLSGLVIVAKHHDGFCLWPTKTTDYNITKSPFSCMSGGEECRDYVKAMADACRRHGLRFGVYVSPWDRHDPDYGTAVYVEKFHGQIKELLNGDYGEVFEMWFDGANGGDGWYGGARERRNIGVAYDYYRFGEVFRFVRGLQPKVCIFGGDSDDAELRWPGNEKGELDPFSGATICSVLDANGRRGGQEYKRRMNTGMRYPEGAAFHNMFFRVCECDFPLRPGWFYHERERGKSKSGLYLLRRYLNSVGNGGTMNIGVAPDKSGRLAAEDVKALADFGRLRDAFFAKPVVKGSCNVVVMSEDVVRRGETCDEWQLFDGEEKLVYGQTIGIKRIRTLAKPREASRLRLEVYGDGAEARPLKFYYVAPDFLEAVLSAKTDSGETDTAKWMTAAEEARDRAAQSRTRK